MNQRSLPRTNTQRLDRTKHPDYCRKANTGVTVLRLTIVTAVHDDGPWPLYPVLPGADNGVRTGQPPSHPS